MKVHLVDGTYELFRSHFGAPPRKGRDGVERGASYGLLRSLARLLRDPEVTHVGVAFDRVVESFRNRLFEGYKTGEGVPEPLREQFGIAERVAEALGLVVWSMQEFEADDALATAAARWADAPGVRQVVICSPDKDLAQCVQGRRVVLFDRRRELVMDEAGVEAKFGVSPSSIPDWLALVGDTADGIPGVPRWGARTSASVLARYPRLEDIPVDAADWNLQVRGAAGLAARLAEHREQVLLYRKLATLVTDVPLTEELEDLAWTGPRLHRLRELADEFEDPRLVERFSELG